MKKINILHRHFSSVSSVLFFCSFFLMCFAYLFFTTASFAYIDPFIALNKKIDELENIGKNAQWPEGLENKCSASEGARLLPDYKKKFTPSAQYLNNLEYETASRRFKNAMEKTEKRLHAIVKNFHNTPASCPNNGYEKATLLLNEIFEERSILLKRSITEKTFFKEYNKAYAEEGAQSKIFEETSLLMKKIKRDFRELKNAMRNLDSGSVSFWKVNENIQQNITYRAQKRGQAYIEDFAQELNTVFDSAYRTRSQILNSLDNLPAGRSHATQTLWPWNDIFSDKINKNIDTETKKYFDKKGEVVHMYQIAEMNKRNIIDADVQDYKQRMQKYMQLEETYGEFDPALSQAVKKSLLPFHITLLETEVLLKQHQKALHSVLNRQNIGVEN